MTKRIGRPPWLSIAVLTVIGFLFFLAMISGERLQAPPWAQPFSTWVFRALYFIHLPAVVTIQTIWPQAAGHAPMWTYFFSCMTLPFVYWKALRVGYRVYGAIERPPQTDPGRRAFLMRSAGGAIAVSGSGIGTYGVVWEPQHLRVRRYNPVIQNLPPALDGLRVVQISDTHYGPLMPMTFLQHVIQQANALEPDVIFLTGDYVHRTPMAIDPGIEIFAGLKSRMGTVAVLGNHDHWEGTDECKAAFDRIGIPLIDNSRTFLTAEGFVNHDREDAMCVAGVGDLWADEISFSKALGGLRSEMPRILLSHNPDVAETMDAAYRVDLMCSGHTHGGQVRMPMLGTPIVPSAYGSKYAGGLCKAPHCRVLVSRGIGLAVLPVRFRVPPEISLITLRSATNTLNA